jgi:hypothetical protein
VVEVIRHQAREEQLTRYDDRNADELLHRSILSVESISWTLPWKAATCTPRIPQQKGELQPYNQRTERCQEHEHVQRLEQRRRFNANAHEDQQPAGGCESNELGDHARCLRWVQWTWIRHAGAAENDNRHHARQRRKDRRRERVWVTGSRETPSTH